MSSTNTAIADSDIGVTLQTGFDAEFGWSHAKHGTASLWFRGAVQTRRTDDLAAELAVLDPAELPGWLDGLDGHFALVGHTSQYSVAAVDPVRSYPLIWARDGDLIVVDHDGPRMERRLGLGPEDIDRAMAGAVALAGYTIGDATLYRRVRQLGPGEYLVVANGRDTVGRYHRWTPWQPIDATPSDLTSALSRLNEQIIDKLVASANGRPILVPLSAGLDSRFVVSGLAQAGYRNVHCFTFGLAGNREAEMSRAIAERLGFDWHFVPYTPRAMQAAFGSDDHARYVAYSDSLTGMHFPQEYLSLTTLRAGGNLPSDAIVVNGQAGDFIAGNHIPSVLKAPANDLTPTVRRSRIVEALLAKHYKHWRALQSAERFNTVRRLLEAEIAAIGDMPESADGDHGIYEYCEFQDRQSKYVLNGQRIYEYLGLDWRLPLWDRAYLDFWEKAPLAAKCDEKLYRDVLLRDDWGGVWSDVPINPTRIRPGWLRPLRFGLKALHAPLGRAQWRRFETQYLDYWMATTCAYALHPYRRIARDRRGHASAIGWHIEAYLNGKGLAFDGTPLGVDHERTQRRSDG